MIKLKEKPRKINSKKDSENDFKDMRLEEIYHQESEKAFQNYLIKKGELNEFPKS